MKKPGPQTAQEEGAAAFWFLHSRLVAPLLTFRYETKMRSKALAKRSVQRYPNQSPSL
jgi:hypothetical protein